MNDRGLPQTVRSRLLIIALALVAALAVPFFVTGMYRMSDRVPTVLPFLVVVGAAAALLPKKAARPLAFGLIGGAVVYAILLLMVLTAMGDGMGSFGS